MVADCESSRKEHIAAQNVPLALTCAHPPIFLPFVLHSICLSILPLLLCVCQGNRASRMVERGPPDESITFGFPQALSCKSSEKQSSSSENPHETREFLGVWSQGWSLKLKQKHSISKVSGMPTRRSSLVHPVQQTHSRKP